MQRPKVKDWQYPKSLASFPVGSTCDSDHLVSINACWRTFKPVIEIEKCIKCLRCFLVCPDGAIDKSGEYPEIDYDFCKGCGICAAECKPGVIHMVKLVR